MHKNKNNNYKAKYNFYKFIEEAFIILNPGKKFIKSKHIDFIHMVLIKLCWDDMPQKKIDNSYYKYIHSPKTKKKINNIIFNLPPRELKSTIISIIWPAWILGHAPYVKILVASSSSRLAINLNMQTKMLMKTEWFEKLFPNCNLKNGNSQIFYTDQNGYRMGCSLEQNIIGYGADYLIMDDPEDPMKINKKSYRDKNFEWFQTVFASRANDRLKSKILLCTARMHKDDLTQKLLNQNFEYEKLTKSNQETNSFFSTKINKNYKIIMINIKFFHIKFYLNINITKITKIKKNYIFNKNINTYNIKYINIKTFSLYAKTPFNFVITIYPVKQQNSKNKNYNYNNIKRFFKSILIKENYINIKISYQYNHQNQNIKHKDIYITQITKISFKTTKKENKPSLSLNNPSNHLWEEFKFPIINGKEELKFKIGEFEIKYQPYEILNNKRYNEFFLEKLKLNIGKHQFNSQYLQTPSDYSSGILKKDYVFYYDIFEIKDDLLEGSFEIIQSWDTSSCGKESANYTACTTWVIIKETYYLIDALRVKLNYKELKELIILHYKKFSDKDFFKKFFKKLQN